MRKRKSNLWLEHKQYGPGMVIYKKFTDHGPALIVQFADKLRTVLVELDGTSFWANHHDALAACNKARQAPKPKAEPQKPTFKLRASDFHEEFVEVGTGDDAL